MRYSELFETSTPSLVSDQIMARILDMITPLAAQGIPSINVNQLIHKLSDLSTGLTVDREMLMSILDPETFPMIKSIEGDILNLSNIPQPRSVTDARAKSDADKIKDTAGQKAISNITKT